MLLNYYRWLLCIESGKYARIVINMVCSHSRWIVSDYWLKVVTTFWYDISDHNTHCIWYCVNINLWSVPLVVSAKSAYHRIRWSWWCVTNLKYISKILWILHKLWRDIFNGNKCVPRYQIELQDIETYWYWSGTIIAVQRASVTW